MDPSIVPYSPRVHPDGTRVYIHGLGDPAWQDLNGVAGIVVPGAVPPGRVNVLLDSGRELPMLHGNLSVTEVANPQTPVSPGRPYSVPPPPGSPPASAYIRDSQLSPSPRGTAAGPPSQRCDFLYIERTPPEPWGLTFRGRVLHSVTGPAAAAGADQFIGRRLLRIDGAPVHNAMLLREWLQYTRSNDAQTVRLDFGETASPGAAEKEEEVAVLEEQLESRRVELKMLTDHASQWHRELHVQRSAMLQQQEAFTARMRLAQSRGGQLPLASGLDDPPPQVDSARAALLSRYPPDARRAVAQAVGSEVWRKLDWPSRLRACERHLRGADSPQRSGSGGSGSLSSESESGGRRRRRGRCAVNVYVLDSLVGVPFVLHTPDGWWVDLQRRVGAVAGADSPPLCLCRCAVESGPDTVTVSREFLRFAVGSARRPISVSVWRDEAWHTADDGFWQSHAAAAGPPPPSAPAQPAVPRSRGGPPPERVHVSCSAAPPAPWHGPFTLVPGRTVRGEPVWAAAGGGEWALFSDPHGRWKVGLLAEAEAGFGVLKSVLPHRSCAWPNEAAGWLQLGSGGQWVRDPAGTVTALPSQHGGLSVGSFVVCPAAAAAVSAGDPVGVVVAIRGDDLHVSFTSADGRPTPEAVCHRSEVRVVDG